MLVGALVAGVIALGGSAAAVVAVGPLGGPTSGPSMTRGYGQDLGAGMMGGQGQGQGAGMMGGQGQGAGMMGGQGQGAGMTRGSMMDSWGVVRLPR